MTQLNSTELCKDLKSLSHVGIRVEPKRSQVQSLLEVTVFAKFILFFLT